MLIDFVKMEGLGNDFVILDIRGTDMSVEREQFSKIADRRRGIGCDQILLISDADNKLADFSYRVVNADGSLAGHCGNGLRCVMLYLDNKKEIDGRTCVEIGKKFYFAEILPEGMVKVDMGSPDFTPEKVGLFEVDKKDRYMFVGGDVKLDYGAVSMGNPHAVVEVKSLENTDVAVLGKKFQDEAGFRNGVNVGFFEFLNDSLIKLKVWERGVGETPSCGTGACAAVAVGVLWGKLSSAVSVKQTGGNLLVEWDGRGDSNLVMTGPGRYVFEGTINL